MGHLSQPVYAGIRAACCGYGMGTGLQPGKRILDRPLTQVSRRPSSNGAFMSIRVSVVVTSAAEIRSVYADLHKIDGLRMLL